MTEVTDSMSMIGLGWREADILAKTERLNALNGWIELTTDLVEMLASDEKFSVELRGAAGAVRTKRNDIHQEIEALKAEIAERTDKNQTLENL